MECDAVNAQLLWANTKHVTLNQFLNHRIRQSRQGTRMKTMLNVLYQFPQPHFCTPDLGSNALLATVEN
jgi:hypothetical protein